MFFELFYWEYIFSDENDDVDDDFDLSIASIKPLLLELLSLSLSLRFYRVIIMVCRREF